MSKTYKNCLQCNSNTNHFTSTRRICDVCFYANIDAGLKFCPNCLTLKERREFSIDTKLIDSLFSNFKHCKSEERKIEKFCLQCNSMRNHFTSTCKVCDVCIETNMKNDLKFCPNCLSLKDRKEFSLGLEARDGLYSNCKQCQKEKDNKRCQIPEVRAARMLQNRNRKKKLALTTTPETNKHVAKCKSGTEICYYCKINIATTHEHIVPLSRGGTHTIDNIVPCCVSCNSSKSGLLLSEWTTRWYL